MPADQGAQQEVVRQHEFERLAQRARRGDAGEVEEEVRQGEEEQPGLPLVGADLTQADRVGETGL